MRRVVPIVAAVLLLTGCNATGPTESPATSEQVFDSELCPGGTGHTCRLSAGEHSSLGFGDGISFTLDGDWIVRANETDVIS
ncbi:MAG TPA: hypothetical protein VFI15_01520, partial [Candidatus Limnocylindrales bacterium]|nr:hypothetical protein [Candidatus Limnocylindrales bacterium]